MATPARHFDTTADVDRLLDVVRDLIAEMGHQSALGLVQRGAHLERELGLGSLERVELLLRIERTFGMRLDERVLAEADTIEDLVSALGAADGRPATALQQAPTTIRAPQVSSGGLAEGLPAAETFQEVLRYRARADAAKAHLIFFDEEGNAPSLTFGALYDGAERVAGELSRRGLGRGDCVAIMLPTSPEFYLVYAGTLLAGATPVPIYPPFRADRIEEYAARQSAILANAGARLLVTFREAERVARLLKPRVASLEGVVTAAVLIESRAGGASAASLGLPMRARGDDLALVQYTSGSTGQPKGVMLTHANLLANVRAIGEAFGMRSNDSGVSWLPLYHDMGLIGAWLLPLYFGVPVVIFSPLAFLSRPVRWLRAIHTYRATISGAPNFAYELTAAKVSDNDLEGLDLSSWRIALNGAEPVLPSTLDRFAARFARCGFRREALTPVYGLAEASLAVTIPVPGQGPRVDRIERTSFERDGRAVPATPGVMAGDADVISFISSGRAIPRHEVRIANASGAPAGEREEGQLWFRGPSATRGYYRNLGATEVLFPADKGEGWVDSGDRAYQANGEIFITGRVKDIIIQAGRNLYPHEIEDLVGRLHGVRKGCVVAFGAPDASTGTERLVIVAESRERAESGRSRIAQEITANVAASVGQPPDVVFLAPPNSIPKTSSGKLRRDATKKKYLAGELGTKTPPVWMQVARLAAGAGAGRVREAVHRAGEIAFGCYSLALFGAFLVPVWLLVLAAPSRKMAARATTAAAKAYLRLAGWRLRIQARENLRGAGPRMFVANHTSYMDLIVLVAALGIDYHFVAKEEVRSMPFFGTFLRKLGHFSFRREDPRARLEQAEQIERVLRQGESVFVFPEGTFAPQAGVRPFQLGAFKAAVAAGRPVQPVALAGTRHALRDTTWLPRPSAITVTICSPITPQATASDWQEIVRIRDAARAEIARLAGEPLL